MDWLDKNGPEPRLPDLKYDNKQLFFIGYAQVWYTLKCHLFKILNINSIHLKLFLTHIEQTFPCSKSTIATPKQRVKIYSKLKIKTLQQYQWRRASVFVVNSEHMSHLFLVVLFYKKRCCFLFYARKCLFNICLNSTTKKSIWKKLWSNLSQTYSKFFDILHTDSVSNLENSVSN